VKFLDTIQCMHQYTMLLCIVFLYVHYNIGFILLEAPKNITW